MEEMSSQSPTPQTYLKVFIALLVLLAITVAAAFVDLDRLLPGGFWSVSVALGIAVAKGLLIMLFFMHVKSGPRRAVAFSGAGFVWLAILLVLTMSDYLTRNHPTNLQYKGEPRFLAPAAAK
jgi:cytochrome c oxidase subunit 4